MDLCIQGKKALLAASTSGLGLACAISLAREGCIVYINGRETERLEKARQLISQAAGAQAILVQADINTSEGRDSLIQACPDADILVNNNAGPPPGTLADWDHASWINALEANLLAPLLLIRALLPGMRSRRFGRIVNITSAMVKSPRASMSLSTTARTGLTAFSKAMSFEAAADNVTLNNLLPERIDTPRQAFMAQKMVAEQGIDLAEARRRIAQTVAAKRFGTPKEFADACAFLCSAQAGFISGQNLQLDGGSYPGLIQPMSDYFRDHLRPNDDPRIASLSELDAYSHAERMLSHPVAHKLFDSWRDLYEQTEFIGITTNGECVKGLFTLQDEQAPVKACMEAVEHFLKGLTSAQKAIVKHAHDARQWHAWMNPEVYMMRFGLRLDELRPQTRDDILAVLRTSLSSQGFERARQLMKINHFLGELVHAPKVMNEFSYNFNLFGTPSLTEPWGWNFYGHHLCLNCRFIGNQMVVTPVFMGAEPHAIDVGPLSGVPVFEREERAGLELMQSLPLELRQQAQLFAQKRDPAMPPGRIAFGDELTLTGAFQDNRVIPEEGLRALDMPAAQQAQLLGLIETYLAYLPEGPRSARMRENTAHLANTWFCWIGGTDDESPFYYRIQSPVMIIEFDHHAGVFLGNPTPEKFHIHTLVRTPNGNDYGMDLVRQHCECMQKIRFPT